jgi:hypothetical protein
LRRRGHREHEAFIIEIGQLADQVYISASGNVTSFVVLAARNDLNFSAGALLEVVRQVNGAIKDTQIGIVQMLLESIGLDQVIGVLKRHKTLPVRARRLHAAIVRKPQSVAALVVCNLIRIRA